MIVPPIIICEDNDVWVHQTVDQAAQSIEAVDVLNGEYIVLDSTGAQLTCLVGESRGLFGFPRQSIEIRPGGADSDVEREAGRRLAAWLTAVGKLDPVPEKSVRDLVELVIAVSRR